MPVGKINTILRITVPNKGSLSEAAVEILKEAGYPDQGDSKSLTIRDRANDIEFFFLRPKDIPICVGDGHPDLGIAGRDLATDSVAPVDEVLNLSFGALTLRYAVPANEERTVEALGGKRIVTSYPDLVREDLKACGINATVTRLDGTVEVSIRLGVADIATDVVSAGRTLRKQGSGPFGDVLVNSEAVVVGRKSMGVTKEQQVFLRRMTGILYTKTYLMTGCNVRASALEKAPKLAPGLSDLIMSPLANEDWVAVRVPVSKTEASLLMDALAKIGAEAIPTSNIRVVRI